MLDDTLTTTIQELTAEIQEKHRELKTLSDSKARRVLIKEIHELSQARHNYRGMQSNHRIQEQRGRA